MRQFTKSEIEGARNYFLTQKYEEKSASLGHRSFNYFVLPQSLEPKLPDFVMRMTGKPSDGYLLGVSDSVQERFRPYAVVHEFIEFTELDINVPHRCTRALEEELKLVPELFKSEYIGMRALFFRNLHAYCTSQPEFYTEADLHHFKHNDQYLHDLFFKRLDDMAKAMNPDK